MCARSSGAPIPQRPALHFDFYGDNLCTSRKQLAEHPERVRAFRSASLKGWAYALSHEEEIVDLIRRKYSAEKSRDALLFEAARTKQLVLPHHTPIGDQSEQRWKAIASTYVGLGMLSDDKLPEGLIYMPDDEGWQARLRAPLLWVFTGTVVAIVLGWIIYRWGGRAFAGPRLSVVMSGLFVVVSIPVLILILLFNFQRNEAAIRARLNDEVAKTKRASIEDAENLVLPVAGALELLAASAANQEVFKQEESRDLLYRALTSAPQIDASDVSFENGFRRVVTRIDDNRRRSNPNIPISANWSSSYIEAFPGKMRRVRHDTFFDRWPNFAGKYDVDTYVDVRTARGYQLAKDVRALIVEEPSIDADTGYPIISVRVPIIKDGAFIGCASADITLDALSRFLANHRASAGSITLIANPANGAIISAPDPSKVVQKHDNRTEFARLDTIADENIREAYRLHRETDSDDFLFSSPENGEEISAAFSRVPISLGKPWEVIILTPTDEFVGTLKRTNRQIIALIAALTGVELLLIYFFSRQLSQPIEVVSQGLRSVQDLTFSHATLPSSNIKEIKELQTAVSLFETSLRSFSSFVPLDVVRKLIRTGTPLTLGVEQRFLTVLFTDLKDFSALSEQMAPNDLLAQLSRYFEVVSQAIAEESGTVDKFIGDGIMAFWGAPAHRDDHVLRACCGALRAARRMQQLNSQWSQQERPPLQLRVGLHSADVLVGNVGSSERLSYAVIGDGVNVAARLEGMNKTFGTTICVSDSVVEAVGADVVTRPIRKVQVKGRKHEFMIYELLGIRNSRDPELAAAVGIERLCDMTQTASEYFERRQFDQAALHYEQILREFSEDPIAKSLLMMCSTKVSLERAHEKISAVTRATMGREPRPGSRS